MYVCPLTITHTYHTDFKSGKTNILEKRKY